MNIHISKSILRFISPKYEDRRKDFRLLTSCLMAQSEDITRTIQGMNGRAHEIAQRLLKKK